MGTMDLDTQIGIRGDGGEVFLSIMVEGEAVATARMSKAQAGDLGIVLSSLAKDPR